MTILRFLNPQGIAGLAVALCLALLLVVQKVETRHWKKQSAGFEQSYRAEQAAFATTVANYRAAADLARQADAANRARVEAQQSQINEETQDAYEKRLADARARYDLAVGRMRRGAEAAADPRRGAAASVPAVPAASGRPDQATSENGLSGTPHEVMVWGTP